MDVVFASRAGFDADNARTPCRVLYKSEDERYSESIRMFQGCPTVAVTRGGRVYLAWYSGGVGEPDAGNYNLLVYSDDGESFSKPLIVIPSEEERLVHALDIQLWIAPNGALWVFWVQNNFLPATPENVAKYERNTMHPVVVRGEYLFPDMRHTCFAVVCDDPDAAEPVFSEPKIIGDGFLRCKPTVLRNGRWLLFNYDQLTDTYAYSVSDDEGRTFTRHQGAKKTDTPFDEAMAYQLENGDVRMLARTVCGELAESTSSDNGITWSEARLSGIDCNNTRFFVSRTPTGRVLLVCNDHRENLRKDMTVFLSDDDGRTWKYKKLIDSRNYVSYPDADFHGDKIYLTYDRERTGAKEILYLTFAEADIMDESSVLTPKIISKP